MCCPGCNDPLPPCGDGSGGPVSGTATCPPHTEFHLHLDADRDGRVDDDRTGLDSWTWGIGGKGAVILCNNDDDGSRRPRLDNDDPSVNGGGDVHDLAPLVIRRTGPAPPSDWEAFIEITAADANRIRIFADRSGSATAIIGPGVGNRYRLPDLTFLEKEFGMEATQYADATFSGEISIKLQVRKGAAGTVEESGKVRVAPWIIFNHYDPTVRVYVVATADNAAFLSELNAAVTSAGIPAPQQAGGRYSVDRWMQDAMEPGYASMPRSGGSHDVWHLPAILRTANDRAHPSFDWGPIDQYPRNDLLAANLGFLQALPPGIGTSLDSFGNLECSPPFTHSGTRKEYKFGRIVYGSDSLRDMKQEVRELLVAQRVQEPFPIDTSWLTVGHVDEVISFCPLKNAPRKFKVLLASPNRALELIEDLHRTGHGSAALFQGIRFSGGYNLARRQLDYPYETVGSIHSNAAFRSLQTAVQAKVMIVRGQLKAGLDLRDSDFIELPVLFKAAGGRYIAYTPGVVNSLVLTKPDHSVRLCMPKPFGPVVGGRCKFEQAIEAALGPTATTGVEIHFIDDFCTYHVLSGEIHCGTNSLRQAPTDRWWWQQTV